MNRSETLEFVETHKAVAILRFSDPDLFDPLFEALYAGGVKILEVTMTVPGALKMIEKAVRKAPSDLLIGVGSVLNAEAVKKSVGAGAEFIVSPIVKEEIIKEAQDQNIAVMPGAFTPTEIQFAWELGADIVKVFPADILGMAFLKAVKAPLPHLKLMPTGGVSLTNGNEWIAAGACAVGVGSALTDKKALEAKDFDQIRKNAELLTSTLKNG